MNSSLGFKLISLEVKNHSILGDNIFTFFKEPDKDKINNVYSSIIIGSNGTGKSELLKYIISLFRNLYQIKTSTKVRYNGEFDLKFLSRGHLYRYTNKYSDSRRVVLHADSGQKIIPHYIEKDGINCESETPSMFLPQAIVSNSIMLTDKFYVPRNESERENFPIYQYLGVRYSPQQASTRYYIRKTVDFIVSQFENEFFLNGLKKLTKFLELESTVRIIYKTIATKVFFEKDITPQDIDDYFKKIELKYSESESIPPFKLNYYLKNYKENKEKMESLCHFIRNIVIERRYHDIYRSSAKKVVYNILNEDEFRKLKNEYQFIEELRKLGFIHAPEIRIHNDIQISQASSGEYHFFSTMIALMATMQPNSLIIIDEPEISLHPNWQMQYLSFIRDLFPNDIYKTCHLIIATHSHFLISDLKGESSSIIALRKTDEGIKQLEFESDINTYGWSPDDVLYNIFGVTSTRNKFVAQEIAEILDKLAHGEKNEINKVPKETYDKLIYLKNSLKDNDPLKDVVLSILNKIHM